LDNPAQSTYHGYQQIKPHLTLKKKQQTGTNYSNQKNIASFYRFSGSDEIINILKDFKSQLISLGSDKTIKDITSTLAQKPVYPNRGNEHNDEYTRLQFILSFAAMENLSLENNYRSGITQAKDLKLKDNFLVKLTDSIENNDSRSIINFIDNTILKLNRASGSYHQIQAGSNSLQKLPSYFSPLVPTIKEELRLNDESEILAAKKLKSGTNLASKTYGDTKTDRQVLTKALQKLELADSSPQEKEFQDLVPALKNIYAYYLKHPKTQLNTNYNFKSEPEFNKALSAVGTDRSVNWLKAHLIEIKKLIGTLTKQTAENLNKSALEINKSQASRSVLIENSYSKQDLSSYNLDLQRMIEELADDPQNKLLDFERYLDLSIKNSGTNSFNLRFYNPQEQVLDSVTVKKVAGELEIYSHDESKLTGSAYQSALKALKTAFYERELQVAASLKTENFTNRTEGKFMASLFKYDYLRLKNIGDQDGTKQLIDKYRLQKDTLTNLKAISYILNFHQHTKEYFLVQSTLKKTLPKGKSLNSKAYQRLVNTLKETFKKAGLSFPDDTFYGEQQRVGSSRPAISYQKSQKASNILPKSLDLIARTKIKNKISSVSDKIFNNKHVANLMGTVLRPSTLAKSANPLENPLKSKASTLSPESTKARAKEVDKVASEVTFAKGYAAETLTLALTSALNPETPHNVQSQMCIIPGNPAEDKPPAMRADITLLKTDPKTKKLIKDTIFESKYSARALANVQECIEKQNTALSEVHPEDQRPKYKLTYLEADGVNLVKLPLTDKLSISRLIGQLKNESYQAKLLKVSQNIKQAALNAKQAKETKNFNQAQSALSYIKLMTNAFFDLSYKMSPHTGSDRLKVFQAGINKISEVALNLEPELYETLNSTLEVEFHNNMRLELADNGIIYRDHIEPYLLNNTGDEKEYFSEVDSATLENSSQLETINKLKATQESDNSENILTTGEVLNENEAVDPERKITISDDLNISKTQAAYKTDITSINQAFNDAYGLPTSNNEVDIFKNIKENIQSTRLDLFSKYCSRQIELLLSDLNDGNQRNISSQELFNDSSSKYYQYLLENTLARSGFKIDKIKAIIKLEKLIMSEHLAMPASSSKEENLSRYDRLIIIKQDCFNLTEKFIEHVQSREHGSNQENINKLVDLLKTNNQKLFKETNILIARAQKLSEELGRKDSTQPNSKLANSSPYMFLDRSSENIKLKNLSINHYKLFKETVSTLVKFRAKQAEGTNPQEAELLNIQLSKIKQTIDGLLQAHQDQASSVKKVLGFQSSTAKNNQENYDGLRILQAILTINEVAENNDLSFSEKEARFFKIQHDLRKSIVEPKRDKFNNLFNLELAHVIKSVFKQPDTAIDEYQSQLVYALEGLKDTFKDDANLIEKVYRPLTQDITVADSANNLSKASNLNPASASSNKNMVSKKIPETNLEVESELAIYTRQNFNPKEEIMSLGNLLAEEYDYQAALKMTIKEYLTLKESPINDDGSMQTLRENLIKLTVPSLISNIYKTDSIADDSLDQYSSNDFHQYLLEENYHSQADPIKKVSALISLASFYNNLKYNKLTKLTLDLIDQQTENLRKKNLLTEEFERKLTRIRPLKLMNQSKLKEHSAGAPEYQKMLEAGTVFKYLDTNNNLKEYKFDSKALELKSISLIFQKFLFQIDHGTSKVTTANLDNHNMVLSLAKGLESSSDSNYSSDIEVLKEIADIQQNSISSSAWKPKQIIEKYADFDSQAKYSENNFLDSWYKLTVQKLLLANGSSAPNVEDITKLHAKYKEVIAQTSKETDNPVAEFMELFDAISHYEINDLIKTIKNRALVEPKYRASLKNYRSLTNIDKSTSFVFDSPKLNSVEMDYRDTANTILSRVAMENLSLINDLVDLETNGKVSGTGKTKQKTSKSFDSILNRSNMKKKKPAKGFGS
jgi:hypothetical protein